jgi:hypothetical protein
MKNLKVFLKSGSEVFVPESNIETFRRIHFDNIVEIVYPDSKGEYKATKKVVESVDVSVAINSFKKENEELAKENEILKETLENLNTIVDDVAEKTAKKSKTKTK